MSTNIQHDQRFHNEDYSEKGLVGKEFDHCVFANCNFTECNLSHVRFSDCVFEGCNLSLAKIDHTHLQNVAFKHSKLMGINFEPCKDFGLSLRFDHCILDFTSFVRKKLAQTVFNHCQLAEANFTQTDLTKASFLHCDLRDSLFHETNLSGADFTTANNFLIDPTINTLKKARFSRQDLIGLLYRYDLVVE